MLCNGLVCKPQLQGQQRYIWSRHALGSMVLIGLRSLICLYSLPATEWVLVGSTPCSQLSVSS